MEREQNLYEPVMNFRKHRPQIQVTSAKHKELYEKAFFSADETSKSEYAENTTTWD